MPTKLSTVKFANSDIDITRLVSGGNPLCGNSHFSSEMNADMYDYYSAKTVVQYLHNVQKAGINTLQARGDYHRILYWRDLFMREGGKLHFVAQTASEMADVFQNIRVIAAAGAMGIYHHGTKTDNMWHDGKIDRVEDYLKCMRDAGVQVGLCTHMPEIIDYVEGKGWDLDFYMACFYNISRKKRESALVSGKTDTKTQEEFLDDDRDKMVKTIRATDKFCFGFKILGASRNCQSQEHVKQAFDYAYGNVKPTDAIIVGMFPKYEDQINLNVGYAIAAHEKAMAEST